MKRFLISCLLIAAVSVAGFTEEVSPVSVELKLFKKQYLHKEPIAAQITVRNISGRDVYLSHKPLIEDGTASLIFRQDGTSHYTGIRAHINYEYPCTEIPEIFIMKPGQEVASFHVTSKYVEKWPIGPVTVQAFYRGYGLNTQCYEWIKDEELYTRESRERELDVRPRKDYINTDYWIGEVAGPETVITVVEPTGVDKTVYENYLLEHRRFAVHYLDALKIYQKYPESAYAPWIMYKHCIDRDRWQYKISPAKYLEFALEGIENLIYAQALIDRKNNTNKEVVVSSKEIAKNRVKYLKRLIELHPDFPFIDEFRLRRAKDLIALGHYKFAKEELEILAGESAENGEKSKDKKRIKEYAEDMLEELDKRGLK